MTKRYSYGWSDPRAMFNYNTPIPIIKRYGEDYVMEEREIIEEASKGFTKSLAQSIQATKSAVLNKIFDEEYAKYKKRYSSVKADAHKYETPAGTIDIETAKNMWVVKYGNEPVPATELVNQDPLMWEIGNRLYWAGELEHDFPQDTYTCKS
jgi:hypothetical protein